MTISSTTDRASFPGNGVTVSFPLPFRFFSDADIVAELIEDSTGLVTELDLGIDYTLTGAGDPEVDGSPTGTIDPTVAPAAGFTLFVRRVMPLTQPTDIVNQGRFYPELHETVFDRLTMLIQQAALGSSRVIQVPAADPVPGLLPNAASRALRVFAFDADGDPVVSSLTLTQLEQQPAGAAASAAAAAASAAAASDSATEASGFANAASASATQAQGFSLKAQEWAENPEDDPVEPGQFSAKHWAAKSAASVSGLDARVTSLEAKGIKIGTAQATTSGTAIDFTGIPSNAQLIYLMLSGVSTTGTSNFQIQAGAGSVETSGYSSSSSAIGASVASLNTTTGFGIRHSQAASSTFDGMITLARISGDSWTASGVVGLGTAAATITLSGSKTFSGAIDRLRFTTVGGTDTFDAGVINIAWRVA